MLSAAQKQFKRQNCGHFKPLQKQMRPRSKHTHHTPNYTGVHVLVVGGEQEACSRPHCSLNSAELLVRSKDDQLCKQCGVVSVTDPHHPQTVTAALS